MAQWTSSAELHEQERRWWWIAGGVGFAAAAWILALPTIGVPAVLGLEALTAIPAGFTAARLWDLNRLHRRVHRPVDEQLDDMVNKQETDRLLARVGRLVDQLPPALVDDGRESYRVAARTAAEHQRLLSRVVDLETILERAKGAKSQRRLRDRLTTARRDADRLHFKLERLAVALAELVDVSDDDDLARVSSRVQESEERLAAVAAALLELRQEGGGPVEP